MDYFEPMRCNLKSSRLPDWLVLLNMSPGFRNPPWAFVVSAGILVFRTSIQLLFPAVVCESTRGQELGRLRRRSVPSAALKTLTQHRTIVQYGVHTGTGTGTGRLFAGDNTGAGAGAGNGLCDTYLCDYLSFKFKKRGTPAISRGQVRREGNTHNIYYRAPKRSKSKCSAVQAVSPMASLAGMSRLSPQEGSSVPHGGNKSSSSTSSSIMDRLVWFRDDDQQWWPALYYSSHREAVATFRLDDLDYIQKRLVALQLISEVTSKVELPAVKLFTDRENVVLIRPVKNAAVSIERDFWRFMVTLQDAVHKGPVSVAIRQVQSILEQETLNPSVETSTSNGPTNSTTGTSTKSTVTISPSNTIATVAVAALPEKTSRMNRKTPSSVTEPTTANRDTTKCATTAITAANTAKNSSTFAVTGLTSIREHCTDAMRRSHNKSAESDREEMLVDNVHDFDDDMAEMGSPTKNLCLDFSQEKEKDEDDDDDDDDEPEIEIGVTESLSTIKGKLLRAGWYNRASDSHAMKTVFVRAGYGASGSQNKEGVHYFSNDKSLRDYIVQQYPHWKGDAVPRVSLSVRKYPHNKTSRGDDLTPVDQRTVPQDPGIPLLDSSDRECNATSSFVQDSRKRKSSVALPRKQLLTSTNVNKRKKAVSAVEPQRKTALGSKTERQPPKSKESGRNFKTPLPTKKARHKIEVPNTPWWKREEIPSLPKIKPLLEKLGFSCVNDRFFFPPTTPGLEERELALSPTALRKFLCQYGIPKYEEKKENLSRKEQEQLCRWIVFANVPVSSRDSIKKLKGVSAPKSDNQLKQALYQLGFSALNQKIYIPQYKLLVKETSLAKHGIHYFDDDELQTQLKVYVRGAWRFGLMHVPEGEIVVTVNELLQTQNMDSKKKESLLFVRLWAAASSSAIPVFKRLPEDKFLLPFELMSNLDDIAEEDTDPEASSDEEAATSGTDNEPDSSPDQADEAETPSSRDSIAESTTASPETSITSTDSESDDETEWYKNERVPDFTRKILPALLKLGFYYRPSTGLYCHEQVSEPIGSSSDVQQFCANKGVPNLDTTELTDLERMQIQRWAAFANVDVKPSNSIAMLKGATMLTDGQIINLLTDLKFQIFDGKIFPPGADQFKGGRQNRKHKVHYYIGLEEIRVYIRGAKNLSLVEDEVGSRRRKPLVSDDQMLSLRLWAALSESPLPVFQPPEPVPVRKQKQADSMEVAVDLHGDFISQRRVNVVESTAADSATLPETDDNRISWAGEKEEDMEGSQTKAEAALIPTDDSLCFKPRAYVETASTIKPLDDSADVEMEMDIDLNHSQPKATPMQIEVIVVSSAVPQSVFDRSSESKPSNESAPEVCAVEKGMDIDVNLTQPEGIPMQTEVIVVSSAVPQSVFDSASESKPSNESALERCVIEKEVDIDLNLTQPEASPIETESTLVPSMVPQSMVDSSSESEQPNDSALVNNVFDKIDIDVHSMHPEATPTHVLKTNRLVISQTESGKAAKSKISERLRKARDSSEESILASLSGDTDDLEIGLPSTDNQMDNIGNIKDVPAKADIPSSDEQKIDSEMGFSMQIDSIGVNVLPASPAGSIASVGSLKKAVLDCVAEVVHTRTAQLFTQPDPDDASDDDFDDSMSVHCCPLTQAD